MLKVSRPGLISSMSLDGRKDIQSVKAARSNLDSELKAYKHVLILYPPKNTRKPLIF